MASRKKATKKKKAPPQTPGPAARPGDRIVEAEFVAGATTRDQFPPPAFAEIAFAGRSNVGKSSLMNCLTERHGLVRTSSTPGCTRQVAWFRAVSDDKATIDLVDLPGYGYAKRSKTERDKWASLIEGFLLERPTLKGVVILTDVRRGFEQDDRELVEMLSDTPRVDRPALEIVLVATKLDKLPKSKHKIELARLVASAGRPVLGFSSTDGTGKVALWRKLRRIAGLTGPDSSEPATDGEARPEVPPSG